MGKANESNGRKWELGPDPKPRPVSLLLREWQYWVHEVRDGCRQFGEDLASLRMSVLGIFQRPKVPPAGGEPAPPPGVPRVPFAGAPPPALRENVPAPAAFGSDPASWRVLVVGGLEFFGDALVRRLAAIGVPDFVLADSLPRGAWRNVPYLPFSQFLSLGELQRDLGRRIPAAGAFSHVFYLADLSGEPDPLALPKTLLAHAAQGGARFISVASACSLGLSPSPADIAMGRPDRFRPRTLPGVVSNLFDRYAVAAYPEGYLALKHHRLFGPGERSDEGVYGLLARTYAGIQARGSVALPLELKPGTEQGDRRHDFLYAPDAARMAVALAGNPGALGFYELGSGSPMTAVELAGQLFQVFGLPVKIDWEDEPFAPPSLQPERADLARVVEAGFAETLLPLPEAIRDYVETDLQPGTESRPEVLRSEESVSSGPRPFQSRKKPFVPRNSA